MTNSDAKQLTGEQLMARYPRSNLPPRNEDEFVAQILWLYPEVKVAYRDGKRILRGICLKPNA